LIKPTTNNIKEGDDQFKQNQINPRISNGKQQKFGLPQASIQRNSITSKGSIPP